MSIFTTLFKRPQKRTADISAATAFLMGGWPGVAEWPDDSYETFARKGYASNELVYACIQQITSSASEARMVVERDLPDGSTERIDRGPLAELIARPSPRLSQQEFLELLTLYLQIAGNSYVYKVRAGMGLPVAMDFLRPDRVQIVPGEGVAAGYVYTVDGREYRIPADDAGHVKLPNPLSDWYGLAPLHVLARQVNLDTGMTDFVKAFFGNAGIPAGLLKIKNKTLSSQEEADYVRARWRNQFNGPQGWHRLAVLDQDADYQQTATRPDEMAMPDLRHLTESRICMAFGVPLSVVGATLGMASSSYANRESDRRMFWEQTLLPLYHRVAEALNRVLLPEFPAEAAAGARVAFDFSDVAALHDDLNAKAERIVKLWDAGLLMRDEARAEMGYDPAPTGHGAVFKAALSTVYLGPDAETAMPSAAPPEPEPDPLPGRARVEDVDPDADEDRPALPEPGKQYITLTAHRPTQRERALLTVMERTTDALTARYEPQIAKHFRALRQRIDGVVGRHMAAPAPETKVDPLPFDADDLVPAEAEAELSRLMRSMYLNVAEATWDGVNTAGLLGTEAFEPNSPAVQRILSTGADRAVKITDATRNALRLALQQGLERGYSIQQIANGVPGDGFPGLKSLVTELYKNRARTIARTETATAINQSAAARYEAGGVAEVIVMDGDQDAACAAVNGSRQTTEWARSNPIAHPNCTRAMLPFIPAYARSRPAVEVSA